MANLLARLGGWCARHGWLVLGLWLVVAGVLTAGTLVLGAPVNNNVTIPGSDAQRAHDLMRDGFGPGYEVGGTVQLIVHAPDGTLTDPQRRQAVDRAVAAVRQERHVTAVQDPYRPGGLSADARIGLITVLLEGQNDAEQAETSRRLVAAAGPAAEAGLEVVAADSSTAADKEIQTGVSEAIGVTIALLVLLLAFGTLVAALIPIFAALISVATGLGVIGLLGHVIDVPKQASIMATMIGIGVGIDYALFLISRHRRLLADGVPVHDAIRRTSAGSGGAVLFAGGTVVISLSAMLGAGFPMLATLGWMTGISVVSAVLTSLTLVPALLGLLGERINALRLPVVGRLRTGGEEKAAGWARLGAWVARRPWPVLTLAVALLAVLAAPALALKLGMQDNGYADQGTAARRAYELMREGFGPGSNGPLLVAAELERRTADPADPVVQELQRRVAAVDGVASVTPARLNESGTAVLFQAIPAYAPSDERTQDVVERVRGLAVAGAEVHVGGQVAGMADAFDRIAERTPLVIGLVVLLSALLLLLAFRAPVVAVKAAVMNLVSLGAAFGALALVFSLGLGSRLVGMDPPPHVDAAEFAFTVPIESFVPLILFAVLFGLSMDYEVFLLTAVRQAYHRSGENRVAVADGLGATGRVITSAALIMVAVFVAFIAYPDPLVKVFGVGLAVAIAVDATVIRGFLVPSTMVLLGRANWWCPRWLDRLLPDLSIEGHEEETPARREPAKV